MDELKLPTSTTAADAERFLAALKTPKLRTFRRTIAASEQTQIDALGTFFYVKEASGPMLVQMDDGEDHVIDVGTGPNMTGYGGFKRLTVKNISTTDVLTIVIYVGVGDFRDNRFTLVPARDFAIPVYEAPTEIKAYVGAGYISGNISATTTITLPGTAVLPRVKRKALVVCNNDPANVLYIRDSIAGLVGIVQPKQGGTYPVSGIIQVRNETASPVPCTIAEIWYTKA